MRRKISEMPVRMPPPELEGLGGFALKAGLHWKEHRPKTYQALLAQGKLRQMLEHHAELAGDEISQAVQAAGSLSDYEERVRRVQEARERALHRYILLPSEDEDPDLTGTE